MVSLFLGPRGSLIEPSIPSTRNNFPFLLLLLLSPPPLTRGGILVVVVVVANDRLEGQPLANDHLEGLASRK